MKNEVTPSFNELSSDASNNLQARAGFWDQQDANKAISRAAKDAQILKGKVKVKVEAEEEVSIAIIALKLRGAAIRSSMADKEMPTIKAISRAAKDEQILLTGSLNAAVALFQSLANEGQLTQQELNVLVKFAQEDFESDVLRSRQRALDAKEEVAALHTCGLSISCLKSSCIECKV